MSGDAMPLWAQIRYGEENLWEEVYALENERGSLKAQVDAWVKENGPGGWIDGLRTQNALLVEALEEMAEGPVNNWYASKAREALAAVKGEPHP